MNCVAVLSKSARRTSWRAFLVILAASSSASADWPMARHDPKRTAASSASSNIVTPEVYWRSYLGGNLQAQDLITADLDGDGESELLYVAGGHLTVSKGDGRLVWTSGLRQIAAVYGVSDVNGDGRPDVIAGSADHVIVLAAADGAQQWMEPDGEVGVVGGVRIADFDGDGRPDVLIQECGCCSVNTGKSGFVYSFGSGFASPKVLYQLPATTCGAPLTTVFDAEGDGKPEIALVNAESLEIADGSSGSILATTPSLGSSLLNSAACFPADLDGVTGQELVCVLNAQAGTLGGRQVFAVAYTAAPTPTASILWQRLLGDLDGGDLVWRPELVADLDGDSRQEVVVSSRTAAGMWTTHVLDAATGVTMAQVPGQRTEGAARLESGNGLVLLTSDDSNLSAWSFTKLSSMLSLRWTLPDARTVSYVDSIRGRQTSLADRLATSDFNGDGIDDIVLARASVPSELWAYSGAGGSASKIATFALPTDVELTVAVPLSSLGALAVIRNDGLLTILDRALQPTVTDPLSGDPGIRVGGYNWSTFGTVASAGVVKQGQSAQSVFVNDSRGALVRFDAQTASRVSPPRPAWSLPHASAPALVDGLDGANVAIACRRLTTPAKVAVLRTDGSEIWSRVVDGRPSDVVPAKLDPDDTPDLFTQTTNGSGLVLRAYSGKDGTPFWNTLPIAIDWGVQPFAVSDWNSDGVSDIVGVANTLRSWSGVGGAEIGRGTEFLGYFTPILQDVDADQVEEVTLQSGFYPARTLRHDLVTPVWTGVDDDRPGPFGAVARCSAGPVLIEGSLQFPSRLSMTSLAGSQAGSRSSIVLASGVKYQDEAAARAMNAQLGQLSNANVEANLRGDAQPSVLVGSTDGYLYALNPCTLSLDFSLYLGAPVSESIFADTNGDGLDEILVTAADGYLYDIRNHIIASPEPVLDTDPSQGPTGVDIDEVETTDSLSGQWSAVSGATGYEVAIVKPTGDFVSVPAWQSVGQLTAATVRGLDLVDGQKYLFSVRAIAPLGASVDGISDGVVVHKTQGDAGFDGGDRAIDAGDATGDVADVADAAVEPTPDAAPEATPVGPESAPDAADAEFAEADALAAGPDAVEGGGCSCRVGGATSQPVGRVAFMAALAMVATAGRRRAKGKHAVRSLRPTPPAPQRSTS